MMARKPFAKKKSRTSPPKTSTPTLEVRIEGLNEDGIGTGHLQGKEIVIPGAFPEERVLASSEHEGQRRIAGRLRKVLTPSPARISSPCPHTQACQGCPLVAMDYAEQLAFKEERVRSSLRGYGSLQQTQVLPIFSAEHPLGYRTNAKLVFARVRGKVQLGIYRRGTHEVTDIHRCPLHHPLINRIAAIVREEVERQGVFVYNSYKRSGLLRYLTIKVSPANNKAMVTFITASREYRQITHLAKWLRKKVPEVISVQQNVNPSEGNVIFGRDTLKILGAEDLIDQVGEMRLRVSPTSFFQVNNEQAAHIYALVRQWAGLSKEELAADLYTGIGGIALHLAQDAGKVIGIEVVEDAVRNARKNARMNNLENCIFRAGNAEDLIQDLAAESPRPSVAVLNPPRSGCEGSVLETLSALNLRTIIYVSCNPQTLARDLDRLHAVGYCTEKVQPVDMFPQTAHVESVARLVRNPRHRKRQVG